MRRALKWTALVAVVLAAGSALAFVVAFPAVVAAACPCCYGLETVDARLHVGRDMTAAEREDLRRELITARRTIAAALGPTDAHPIVLGCSTDDCDRRIGGRGATGARAETFTTPWFTVIRLGPRGLDETILAHELAHVTMHRIVGPDAVRDGRFPAWLNEGMAVIVSEDDRYLRPGTTAEERCMVEPNGLLPADPFEWGPAAGRDHLTLYAQAACATLRWLEANGGTEGLLDALRNTARTGSAIVDG